MRDLLTLAELIDLARKQSGIPSDRKLAAAMDVVPQQISQWRHGTHVPKGEHVQAIAHLSGLTEEYVLICLVSAEAKRSTEERRVLRQIAEQLKKTAAVVTLAIAGFLGVSYTPAARASSEAGASDVYYVEFDMALAWQTHCGDRVGLPN